MSNETTNDAVLALDAKPEKKEAMGVFFWFCLAWIGLNVLVAVFANVLPVADPVNIDFNHYSVLSPPNWSHWFGTDGNSRDIFSRVVWGARSSLYVSISANLIGFVIGGSAGMYSAYRRGKIDLLLSSVSLVFIAFPALIAVIAVLSFWQPGSEIKVIIVLGITSIPIVYRVIRAATLSAANQDYILAAKVQGATDRRILLRELLPNVAPTGLSFLMLGIASIIGVQGTLAFLGIQQGDAPNWGEMINESRSSLDQSPWLAIFPSIALVLLILSLNFVGDRFRARFDVTEVKI